ncbi:DUF1127 domain-containing protein [Halomonas urumqiensis]|uniref:YjiS-like domain-containing protein n=1 Tax=Halomonas urumqiensis TaxID=1684789 RepID=A0A2N7UDE1_9GAMM|nr:DUF1127 domain-containing protein [Halomonas urumqiensis]PMR78453.1 hypothetical protein C1H70_17055 [Halomonas urumqiensis]PTB03598.1 DUF1127 domain-containing protein [Halomonas urumqiensis]GHE20196.1 hypothetical protein GCM10017767_07170 [Halomonas urumqiensis]
MHLPSLTSRLRVIMQRRRTRRALLGLDKRLLDDIGINPEQARREATKPFWKP